MKILLEKAYDEMAMAFQCFQIQTLYKALKENNVDESKIREICEDFTISFAVGLDQFWIETEVGKVFPVVGFTKRHMDHDPDSIYLNPGSFLFDEYAYGDNAWFFEENDPNEEPQKCGPKGKDGNPT
jgi:hypothetical protein